MMEEMLDLAKKMKISLSFSEKIQNICYFLLSVLGLLFFFLTEFHFLKILFFLNYFSWSEILSKISCKLSFKNSLILKTIMKFILLYHFLTNIWLYFVETEKNIDISWYNELNFSQKNLFEKYIYAIKWVFHIFFPYFSVYFNTFNENEILFEIINIAFFLILLLFNMEYFIFFARNIKENARSLVKLEDFSNFLIESGQKKEIINKIMKKNMKKVNKGNLLKTTSCFKEITGIYYEEFIQSVLTPIIREKLQFFSKNFSETTIKKLLPLFELKRYNKGDLLIDVFLIFIYFFIYFIKIFI